MATCCQLVCSMNVTILRVATGNRVPISRATRPTRSSLIASARLVPAAAVPVQDGRLVGLGGAHRPCVRRRGRGHRLEGSADDVPVWDTAGPADVLAAAATTAARQPPATIEPARTIAAAPMTECFLNARMIAIPFQAAPPAACGQLALP